MSMQRLVLVVLVAVVSWTSSFTVHDDEAAELPEMLQPIVRGGSWFDDMALEILQEKHDKLESEGKLEEHNHEDDSEEMFIMKKLGLLKNETKHDEHKKAEHASHHHASSLHASSHHASSHHASSRGRVQTSISKSHGSEVEEKSHKETVNGDNLAKNNKHHIHGPMTTEQFMALYEKELQGFFKKFMGVMSKAEIGGVNIERRIDNSNEQAETGARTNVLQS